MPKQTRRSATRTENVSVRLDPKTNYLLQLAARIHRRTVSNYAEWAIDESLKRVEIRSPSGASESLAAAAARLWSADETDRLRILNETQPELLSFAEEARLKDGS